MMDWKRTADELYNELQREKAVSRKYHAIIGEIQEAYQSGSGDELDEVLDKLFSNETEDLSY